jgi:acyl dehydratase
MSRTVESVADLKALVGQEIGVSSWLEMTQDRIDDFAKATGDYQWIHVDVERSRLGPFGATIAHGFLTLSLLPTLNRLREGTTIDLHAKMGINYGLNRVRFPAPVRCGKRVRLRTVLQEVTEPAPNVVQIVYQQTIEIEGEEKPAMVAETVGRQYL